MRLLSLTPSLDLKKEFPDELLYELEKLPIQGQLTFLDRYSNAKRGVATAYFFHFFGLAYAYQGKWFKQILSWLTLHGLGIWWLVNWFRLPKVISKENHRKARRIIGKLQKKYDDNRFHKENGFVRDIAQLEKIVEQLRPQPRQIEATFDPANLSVGNLKKGFLVDYALLTWLVVDEYQYDFWDNTTEKAFRIVSENDNSMDILYLHLRLHESFALVHVGNIVNIHSIDESLQRYILAERNTPNIIFYKGKAYFKESSQQGIFFHLTQPSQHAKKVYSWEFLDEQRTLFLRIQWIDGQEFLCLHGKIVSKEAFSEILPVGLKVS